MPNGVAPAMFAEMFSTPVRYSGVGLSSQLGQLIAGFAPTIAAALVAAAGGGWIWVAVATAGACLVSAVSALTVRETFQVPAGQLGAPVTTRAAGDPGQVPATAP